MIKKTIFKIAAVTTLTVVALGLANCGGGGGGGGGSVLYYPYKTVFGDVCSGTTEPTPGCTFLRTTGERISVVEDRNYNRFGGGSNDMDYVYFDVCLIPPTFVCGYVNGSFVDVRPIEQFAGFQGGSTIGVGVTGLFWEDVLFGTYWWGRTGVLYSAEQNASNYGRAINSKDAYKATSTNLAAAASDDTDVIVDMAAAKLEKEYGFKPEKAQALASSLNSWAEYTAERGYNRPADFNNHFTAAFTVKFSTALAAVQEYREGKAGALQKLTIDMADGLQVRPDQVKRFIKDSFREPLASRGININAFNW